MKAAWKMLQKEYPWLTAMCCGTHVLSLELKDLGKLPEVDAIISKVSLSFGPMAHPVAPTLGRLTIITPAHK